MSETVVVRTRVDAALNNRYMGERNQLIAAELQGNGIPAVVGPHGIHVNEGTLDVYEEDGLRVFAWHPHGIKVPVPEGDNNAEVTELQGGQQEGETLQGEEPDGTVETAEAQQEADTPLSGELDSLRATGAKPTSHSKKRR